MKFVMKIEVFEKVVQVKDGFCTLVNCAYFSVGGATGSVGLLFGYPVEWTAEP